MSDILVRLEELDMNESTESLAVLEDMMSAIVDEYTIATEKFGKFVSPHEGLAIIEEEFLEFREAVFWPHKEHTGEARQEAIQLAAMALRFLMDIK
jgi:hypothetical protein